MKLTYKKLVKLCAEESIETVTDGLRQHKIDAKSCGLKKGLKRGDKLSYREVQKLVSVQFLTDVFNYKMGRPISKQTFRYDLKNILKMKGL